MHRWEVGGHAASATRHFSYPPISVSATLSRECQASVRNKQVRNKHVCPGDGSAECRFGSEEGLVGDARWHYGRVPGHVNELEYEVPWGELLAPRPSAGHIVGELLPPGFDRYLRVFHPFVPWDAEPDSSSPISHRASREDLANEAGVPFGPTLTWRQLEVMLPVSPVGQRRRWAVWDGYLEEATADALFDSLNDDSLNERSGRGPRPGSPLRRPPRDNSRVRVARESIVDRMHGLRPHLHVHRNSTRLS